MPSWPGSIGATITKSLYWAEQEEGETKKIAAQIHAQRSSHVSS
jgi:hypothetical protein